MSDDMWRIGLRLVTRWHWGMLLALLIFALVFEATAPRSLTNQLLTKALYLIIFGGAVYAARVPRWLNHGFIGVSIAWSILASAKIVGGQAHFGDLLTVLTLAVLRGL